MVVLTLVCFINIYLDNALDVAFLGNLHFLKFWQNICCNDWQSVKQDIASWKLLTRAISIVNTSALHFICLIHSLFILFKNYKPCRLACILIIIIKGLKTRICIQLMYSCKWGIDLYLVIFNIIHIFIRTTIYIILTFDIFIL